MTPARQHPAVRLSVNPAPCTVPGRGRFVARLEATPSSAAPCSARIIVAIDKSASMRGQPLRDAQAAACALVDHLDDGDEVGLLCFHRLVDEIVHPARLTPDVRSFLKEQILAVTTGHGTNIGEACRVGLRLLGEPEGVGRLVLLSDGEPSVGILGREDLVERVLALRPHCTVSAVGLGDHSDPWLMRALAIAGRGAYAFVPENTSPHLALGAALAGCRHVEADDLELRFRLAADVRLRKVFYRGPAGRIDADRVVHLEPLCANDPVHIAFEVEFAAGAQSNCGWLEMEGRYVPTREGVRMRHPLLTSGAGSSAMDQREAAKHVALARLGVALFDAGAHVQHAPAGVACWLRGRAMEILDELYRADVEAGPEVSALYELAIELADELATSPCIEVGRRLVHYGDGAAFRRDSMPDVVSTLAVLARRTSVSSTLMLMHRTDHGDYE